jgi:hypothetical protein
MFFDNKSEIVKITPREKNQGINKMDIGILFKK